MTDEERTEPSADARTPPAADPPTPPTADPPTPPTADTLTPPAADAPTSPSEPGADAGAAFFPRSSTLPDPAPPVSATHDTDLAVASSDVVPVDPGPATPVVPVPAAPVVEGPPIPLVTTRGLLPAAFDLILRSNEDMRRASFYIGAVTLGTVGPLALALWVLVIGGETILYPTEFGDPALTGSDVGGAMGVLGIIALLGFIVAAIESRTLATAVLGGQMRGRPISLRHAVTRARARFWPAVGASFVVGVVLAICQGAVDTILAPILGAGAAEATLITSTIVTATVGAPFAYVLCGVVLGDVGALESIRRSFMVARARWSAAAIIVTFETATVLLIAFGLSAGADILIRGLGVLGIGPDSGPAGLAVATVVIIAAVFAVGTLLYTVTALTVAPQVVMFVGLTHATIGLDRIDRTASGRFFSLPMLGGVLVAALLLLVVVLSG